jgi:hypothetical protein
MVTPTYIGSVLLLVMIHVTARFSATNVFRLDVATMDILDTEKIKYNQRKDGHNNVRALNM